MHKEKWHRSFSSRTNASRMWTLVSQVLGKVFLICCFGMFHLHGNAPQNRIWNISSIFKNWNSYLLLSPRYFSGGSWDLQTEVINFFYPTCHYCDHILAGSRDLNQKVQNFFNCKSFLKKNSLSCFFIKIKCTVSF